MRKDHLSLLRRALVGQACSAERVLPFWLFTFGDAGTLRISAPWRIASKHGVRVGSLDEKISLLRAPANADGQWVVNDLLDGQRVISVDLCEATADIRVEFDAGQFLETFQNSAQFEGWEVHVNVDGRSLQVIGMGGGSVSIFAT